MFAPLKIDMKKIVSVVTVSVIALVALVQFSSCGGEKSTVPTIAFREGSAYVYKDTAIVQGTVFNVGINASKTGTEGILTNCKIDRSINGAPDSTIQNIVITTQYFTQYFSYRTGDSGNTEKYTFTVTKNDGLQNSVSVTVTDK